MGNWICVHICIILFERYENIHGYIEYLVLDSKPRLLHNIFSPIYNFVTHENLMYAKIMDTCYTYLSFCSSWEFYGHILNGKTNSRNFK